MPGMAHLKNSSSFKHDQCDQMLRIKIKPFFQNLPKSIHNSFYLKREVFQNSPKVSEIFKLIL